MNATQREQTKIKAPTSCEIDLFVTHAGTNEYNARGTNVKDPFSCCCARNTFYHIMHAFEPHRENLLEQAVDFVTSSFFSVLRRSR